MHSWKQLAADFRSLGVAPGDVVMVHASVRSVGEVAGGPDEIHLALKDALTVDGTMLMYAACPAYMDEVGRGHLSAAQEAELLEKLPPFDANTARSSRENGALVELFRTYPGSSVNQHVTRFVAWGKQAGYLFSRQPWDFAFGKDSALERLVEMDGKILSGFVRATKPGASAPPRRLAVTTPAPETSTSTRACGCDDGCCT